MNIDEYFIKKEKRELKQSGAKPLFVGHRPKHKATPKKVKTKTEHTIIIQIQMMLLLSKQEIQYQSDS